MGNIRQWVAWAEGNLARVVVGEGLHVARAGVVEGPNVVTFRLRLLRPDRRSVDRLLTLDKAFAQSLHVDRVRVVDTAQGILIEIPHPAPKTPDAATLAAATQGLRVAVGLDQWRKPVTVDLTDHPVLLFVGPTGRGKSSAMRATLFALASRNPARRLRYVIVAQKASDWSSFGPAAGCLAVVTDPDEARDALAWAAGELLQGRAKSGDRSPAVVFVVDDLANLLQRAPDAAGFLGELASMGRGAAVFVILGTQQAGSKSGTGGTLVEDNVTARIIFKASTATSGARSAGFGGLGVDQLSGRKGDALLLVDDGAQRIATAVVDDRQIALLREGEGFRPWAKSRSNPVLQNGLERARTGENGQNGAVLGAHDPAATPHGDAGEGGTGENGSHPFLTSSRPPTAEERRQLREAFAHLGSREKVYRAAWGFKNGVVAAWLRDALAEGDDGQVEPPAQNGVNGSAPDLADFDALDLNSPAGRATFEELLRSGKVRFPEPAIK